MGFGIKAVEKATGKVIWVFPMDDMREIIVEHGSTDAFVEKLRLREKYPEAQYEIYLVTSSGEQRWDS
ncbi:MAG: hypothetical protein KME42_28680 [Tildeniella nuda ZEHNDER 1965/U140]|jgi:hypothetical protein|nr:hypothetical protein [Tildeniella nuda ZEHNDER 1965/U140]